MKRLASLTAVTVLALGGLTACGGNDYCDVAKASIADPDVTAENYLDKLNELRDAAPDEIKDDWDTVIEAIENPTADASADALAATEAITAYTEKECDITGQF